MSLLKVKTEWRGSTLKLRCSLMRDSNNYKEMTTETIDFDGLAQIVGKLQSTSDNVLQLRIGIKKSEAAKNFIILANIKYMDYDKEFACSEEWVEVKINKHVSHEGSIRYNSLSVEVFLYIVVVNITLYATMNPAGIVNNLLYEDADFTDFQLHTTDGTVAVHKAVLAVHGDMFKTMLRGEWKETKEASININGVTLDTLKNLKKYMYLGTLPDEGIEPLLLMAAPYLMEKLETDCIKKLIETLTPEKFNDLIEFASQNKITKLVIALVLRIPDDIVNGVHQLNLKKQKSDDEK